MVKGISRQVVVVHSPDPKLFEQAIFILREDAKGVTDAELLKEAKLAVRGAAREGSKRRIFIEPLWLGAGAGLMGLAWWICSVL